jgi:hypothetical protein
VAGGPAIGPGRNLEMRGNGVDEILAGPASAIKILLEASAEL